MRTSIVIPVYNDEEQIKHCLDCIALQTKAPDTVVVVDNNCTDNSIEIARRYSFVTIITETNQGICAATKAGLDFASRHSDIMLRCDADSRPQPDWISQTLQILNQETGATAVTGPGVFYDGPALLRKLANVFYMKAYFWSVGLALGQKPLFGSNFAIKSDAWRQIKKQTHLNKQNIHDDIDISFHAVQYGNIHYSPRLEMPISARPFNSLSSLLKRYPMGLRSIFIHWPQQAPWRRFIHRISGD